MNQKSLYKVLVLLLFVTAGSCYSSKLTLSVLQPADTVLPASIQKLSIIPMPGVTSGQEKIDSTGFYQFLGDYEVKMGAIHGLHLIFSQSPRFTKVVLTDTSVASFIHNQQVSWDDLANVCRHDTTDVILLMSRSVTYETQYLISPTSGDFNLHLINQSGWTFYDPEKQLTLARFNYNDTVLCPSYLTFYNQSYILYSANHAIGELCGKRLAPYWIDVSRIIYSGPGKDLRDAARFVAKNKWRNAGLLWNDLVTDKSIKIASRAAFNLSLAFEREDDLEQAFLWAAYSDSLKSTELSSAYLKIISDRIKKQERLDRQMTGN